MWFIESERFNFLESLNTVRKENQRQMPKASGPEETVLTFYKGGTLNRLTSALNGSEGCTKLSVLLRETLDSTIEAYTLAGSVRSLENTLK